MLEGRELRRRQPLGLGSRRGNTASQRTCPDPGPGVTLPPLWPAPLRSSAKALPGVDPNPVHPTLRFLPETRMWVWGPGPRRHLRERGGGVLTSTPRARLREPR